MTIESRGGWTGLALLALAGCGLFEPGHVEGLGEAVARWNQRGPRDYQIVVRRECFCGSVDPVRVTVIGGEVTERRYVTTDQPVPETLAELYPGVPGLFALVADAYHRADRVDARFDPELGFPTVVAIDYVRNAVDDELTLTAGNLQELLTLGRSGSPAESARAP